MLRLERGGHDCAHRFDIVCRVEVQGDANVCDLWCGQQNLLSRGAVPTLDAHLANVVAKLRMCLWPEHRGERRRLGLRTKDYGLIQQWSAYAHPPLTDNKIVRRGLADIGER